MELGVFTPRPPRDELTGDKLQAKETVDKPLVVYVREHRTGIKTKYNSNPAEKNYKPDGQDGVTVDVADINADQVYIDVLWLNGRVVDDLADYLGQVVPVKLQWMPSSGNPFIGIVPLDGAELAAATAWARANPNRFDTERAQRRTFQEGAPAAAPDFAKPEVPAQAPPPATGNGVDLGDPAVQALLAQLAAQQSAAK